MSTDRTDRPLGERVASLEKDMQHLMGNGQPGIIAEIRESLKRIDRFVWIVIGVVLAASFLTGNGTLTLDHLLKALTH